MKVRRGFVSNSSSSSFLIYGACLDTSDFEAAAKEGKDEDGRYGDDVDDLLEKIARDFDLCHITGQDQENHYLGVSWDSIDDDETGLQFRQNIEAVCAKISEKYKLKKPLQCGTHSEAWYDG